MAFARKNTPVTVLVLSLALTAIFWQIASAPGLGHAADDPGPPGPGYPLIVITTPEVEMRSTIDFDETEATTQHFFPAADPLTTGGFLEITIEGEYGSSYHTATPFTEGTPLSEMGSTGEDCVPVSAIFALSPEEMSALLEDGMAEITIQNSALVAASCERNRHSVSLRYRNPLGDVVFGDVPVGRTREMPLTVFNPGSSLLQVSSMISDDTAFVVSPASLDVPAGESRTARVRYSATSIGTSSASLLLTSNDLTQPVVEVMLSAGGVDPPIIQVTPAQLSATLFESEQAVQAITIHNAGGSALDFQINVGPPRGDVGGACTPVQAMVTEFFLGLTRVDLATGATTPVSTDLFGSAGLELNADRSTAYVVENGVGALSRVEIASGTTSTIATGLSNPFGLAVKRDESLAYVGHAGIPIISQVDLSTGLITTAAVGPRAEALALNQAEDTLYFTDPAFAASGGLFALDLATGLVSTVAIVPGAFGLDLSPDETTALVTNLATRSIVAVDLASGSTQTLATGLNRPQRLAVTATGSNALVTEFNLNQLLSVDLVTGFSTLIGPVARPYDVALLEGSCNGAFLSLALASGSLAPGATIDVDVLMDSTGLPAGTYLGGVDVISNDPANGLVSLLATLDVLGRPQLSLQAEEQAESSAVFTLSGQTTLHPIAAKPQTVGEGILDVTVDGDFGLASETASVSVEGALVATLGGIGGTCVSDSRSIVLDADTLAAAAADGEVRVEIGNSPSVNPSCSLNRHSVRLTYNVPVDALDLGPLFVGDTATREIIVANPGPGSEVLEITSILSDVASIQPSLSSMTVLPRSSGTLTVTFDPTTIGAVAGHLAFLSNDLLTPLRLLPISGQALVPPAVGVTPGSLSATLAVGGEETQILTLSNTGGSDLEFSLEVIDLTEASDVGFLSVQPAAASVPPGESLQLMAQFDARDVLPGVFLAEIRITSNDPAAALVVVPATLTAFGAPNLVVDDRLELISIQDYGPDNRTVHSFPINGMIGTSGTLELIADGDYGSASETATAVAEGIVLGSVGGIGPDCVPASGSFPLDETLLANLLADDVVIVEVENSSTVGLFCSVNRHTVRLLLPRSGPVNLGGVFLGASASLTLEVRNTGTDVLEVHSIVAEPAEFSVGTSSLTLQPGASSSVQVTFSPAVEGVLNGSLRFFSNDPDQAELSLDLVGEGLIPPVIVVIPTSFSETLMTGETSNQLLTLLNLGGSDLRWEAELRSIPSGQPTWLALTPGSGTVAATGSQNATLTFNATALAGEFDAEIVLTSNDPLTPELTLPVHLTVIGAPDIAVLGEEIVLESVQDYVGTGSFTMHSLAISEPPTGGASVALEVDGDYGSLSEFGRLSAEGLILGDVGGAGADCIPTSGTFELDAGQFAGLVADGIAGFTVSNSASVNDFCAVNRHTVRVSYRQAADALGFGAAFVGGSAQRSLGITNVGTDVLTVTLSTDGPVFVAESTGFSLEPGALHDLPVTFLPPSLGPFSGILTITSDDPDTPSIEIPLSGEGVAPPVVDVLPGSLSSVLAVGAEETQALIVFNRGGSPLEFAIRVTPPGALVSGAGSSASNNPESTGLPEAPEINGPTQAAVGTFEPLAVSPVPLTCVVEDRSSGLLYAQQNNGTGFFRYLAATDTWESLTSSPLNSGNNGSAALLNGTIYTSYNTPVMGAYDIATDSWSVLANPLAGGNLASDGTQFLYSVRNNVFVRFDPETAVTEVLPSPPIIFSAWGGLRYLDGVLHGHTGDGTTGFARYDVATGIWEQLASLPDGAVKGAAINPFQRTYYTYGPYEGNSIYEYSMDSGLWTVHTIPDFVVNDGGMGWLPGAAALHFVQGQNGTRFSRLLTPGNLAVSPVAGVVEPGGSATLLVTFSAASLLGGIFEEDIHIDSNDPLTPRVTVPTILQVVGVPGILVSAGETLLESVLNYAGDGSTTSHAFAIGTPAVGEATVELEADGDYGSSFETASLSAEGSFVGSVGGFGADCVAGSDAFTLTPARFADLSSDGIVQFDVQNSSSVGDFCATNRHTVRLRYKEAAELLDFGTLFVGESRELSLEISNVGTDILEIQSVSSDLPEFSTVSPVQPSMPPHSSQTVVVRFTPSADGLFQSTLRILSNDPDEGEIALSLRGQALLPPIFDFSPESFDETLPPGGQSMRTLTITNPGGSPLTFALELTGGTEVLFFDDMEAGPGDWQHKSTHANGVDLWEQSTSRASSGATSWHVQQHGSQGADALQTPAVDLTGVSKAKLSFHHWYNFDDCGDLSFDPDGGVVEVSIDGGATWVRIFPDGGYPYVLDDICFNPLAFQDAYSHDSDAGSNFVEAQFDLDAFTGHVVDIRFHAGWDCGNCAFNEGWYIADVAVTSAAPAWLAATQTSGTVQPGGIDKLDLIFDAATLPVGVVEGTVQLTSNDPLRTQVDLPVRLTVNTPPQAIFEPPAPTECTGPSGATVLLDGSGSQDADSTPGTNDHIVLNEWFEDWGLPAENLLGSGAQISVNLTLGDHVITLVVTDALMGSDTATHVVRVQDTASPSLIVLPDQSALWPANHRLVNVSFDLSASDLCDPSPVIELVSGMSSEPDNAIGDGDGDTVDDMQSLEVGTADVLVRLRAERAGSGLGRTYELSYRAVDASGNLVPVLSVVSVPHDLSGNSEPVLVRLRPDEPTGGLWVLWPTVPESSGYDVLSGRLEELQVQDHVLLLGSVEVLARGTQETAYLEDVSRGDPALGEIFLYVVQARTDLGNTGYGTATAPYPREPVACSDGCP